MAVKRFLLPRVIWIASWLAALGILGFAIAGVGLGAARSVQRQRDATLVEAASQVSELVNHRLAASQGAGSDTSRIAELLQLRPQATITLQVIDPADLVAASNNPAYPVGGRFVAPG